MQEAQQGTGRTTSDSSTTGEEGVTGGEHAPFQIRVTCASKNGVSYYLAERKPSSARRIKNAQWQVAGSCDVVIVGVVPVVGGMITKKRLLANGKILQADIEIHSKASELEYELCVRTTQGEKCLAYGGTPSGLPECIPCDSSQFLRPQPPPKVIIQ